MNPVVRGDIVVEHFLNSVGGYRHKERRDQLLDILDVDLDWHMHTISDGERRRVQLCMGLMEPWDILLLDEVCHHMVSTAVFLDQSIPGVTKYKFVSRSLSIWMCRSAVIFYHS
jgi:ABC-type uncharacterized transport system ATPase subunit